MKLDGFLYFTLASFNFPELSVISLGVGYSSEIPACLTTFAQRLVSSLM